MHHSIDMQIWLTVVLKYRDWVYFSFFIWNIRYSSRSIWKYVICEPGFIRHHRGPSMFRSLVRPTFNFGTEVLQSERLWFIEVSYTKDARNLSARRFEHSAFACRFDTTPPIPGHCHVFLPFCPFSFVLSLSLSCLPFFSPSSCFPFFSYWILRIS